MYKILVTDDRFGSYEVEEEVLRPLGAEVILPGKGFSRDLKTADGVLLNQFPLTAKHIETMDRCKVISRYGTGYDNVDVAAATSKGIWVARVPDYCYEEVADHALALLLSCARRIPFTDRKVREGAWNIHAGLGASRIRGKVLGIIGYGGTGRMFHRKASVLGFSRILVCDHHAGINDLAVPHGEIAGCDRLLAESDFISLHIPMREENHHLIDESAINLMKHTAILINTSRGGIVETEALVTALKEKRLDSAGLDVYEQTPPDASLLALDNVVLTDHCAYYSRESLIELKTKAARNIVAVLSGREPVYPVNNILGGRL
ncbi:MAG: C-terminal binding protein [Spirochaetales bacterium]|nr:C-terminal binding protein [Spirochaetales bacterium]